LGSVGNLAQAVVVAESSKESINENNGLSNETFDNVNDEDYESEGHYAVVDEQILQEHSNQRGEDKNNSNNSVEAIYAKVNKDRKTLPQVCTCICKSTLHRISVDQYYGILDIVF
jgi:hypothetical protein